MMEIIIPASWSLFWLICSAVVYCSLNHESTKWHQEFCDIHKYGYSCNRNCVLERKKSVFSGFLGAIIPLLYILLCVVKIPVKEAEGQVLLSTTQFISFGAPVVITSLTLRFKDDLWNLKGLMQNKLFPVKPSLEELEAEALKLTSELDKLSGK